MKNSGVLVILIFISFWCEAQKDSLASLDTSKLYTFSEEMPEFIGGQVALFRYITKHIRYDKTNPEYDMPSSLSLTFIIERDGRVSDVISQKESVPLDGVLRKAMLGMPAWKPGRVEGKTVRFRYPFRVSCIKWE